MSHVTHMNESCHTNEWVMFYTYEWDMSHIKMRHVTYKNESCHTYEWVMSHIVMNESCHTYHTWRLDKSRHTCHTYRWMSHVIHRYIYTYIYTRTLVLIDQKIDATCHTYEWVMSHTWMSHVTHMNESCHTHERVMSHSARCTSARWRW